MKIENEEIIQINQKGIAYLQFKRLLEYPEIKHCYTLKTGDLNFNWHRKTKEELKESYKKICDCVRFPYNGVFQPIETHSANILFLGSEGVALPSIAEEKYKDVDGVITNQTGITLSLTNADCILFLLYDPVKKIVANIHSGWRGTFQKIIVNGIHKMRELGCAPKDILVCICPSIRVCHFEVDEDVKEECENLFSKMIPKEQIILKGRVVEGKQKYLIDTILINQILLKEEGILPENIIDSGICSVCNSELIHSRRADGAEFGLGVSMIALEM